ncbi:MAG: glycosyltransferase family 39 protein [Gammaproteobacteria bacterium]|jgi:hypothetical protein
MLAKIFLASRLDLYSDEVFYWLASEHLAPAYSDLPFMTSLLVKLGSSLDPGSTLAARSLFILIGSCLPVLVYWLANPIVGKSEALMSALLSLCIPLGGFLGLLAVPDVPLLFFGILSIGLFERSLRTNRLCYWLAAGLVAAMGLATHYRFLLYPAAAVLFLVYCKSEHRQFRNPFFWAATGLAALGLIPVIWFNLSHQLASASFYLVERHPWTFQASGLLHSLKQAVLVTPPLYLLLGFTLWRMLLKARGGDQRAGLLASFALVNLLVYLILAPWTDSSSTSIHWPLSGYFPLLVYAPATLRSTGQWTAAKWNTGAARIITPGIPALGFCGSVLALLAIGSQAFQIPLQALLGTGVLSNKMAGWREFTAHTATVIESGYPEELPVLVTDNYYTAAQLRFAGTGAPVFTTDSDKSVRDGRRLQLTLWGMDATALTGFRNRPALFITEDSTLSVVDKEAAIGAMCRQVADLSFLSNLRLFNGEKQFSYYQASRLSGVGDQSADSSHSCPYPARAWLEPPVANASLSGTTHMEGWAYQEDIGIQSVSLLLNDEEIASVDYGISRPDVVDVMAVESDPNAPDLGFSYELDTRPYPNGRYRLALKLTDNRGVTTIYGERPVFIVN